MRRHPVAGAERADQVRRRQIGRGADRVERQRLPAVRGDIVGRARELRVVVATPSIGHRAVERAVQPREECHRRALLRERVDAGRDERAVETTELREQIAPLRPFRRKTVEIRVRVAAERMLEPREPRHVDVHHPVRPVVGPVRIARMHLFRIDDDEHAAPDVLVRRAVHVRARAADDRADRERVVRVLHVAEFAPVVDGARFDERQRGVAPERRRHRGRADGTAHATGSRSE